MSVLCKSYRQDLLVSGYVRAIEEICIDSLLQNVPTAINDIIYLYQMLYDGWSRRYSNKRILISNNSRMILVDKNGDRTAFGASVISPQNIKIFRWRIKMISAKDGFKETPSFIGVIADDEEAMRGYHDSLGWSRCGYQLCGGSGELYCNYHETKCIATNSYQCRFHKEGDVLEMTLDLNELTISYALNGQDFGVAFHNIKPRNYRLAWSTFNAKGAVFLLLE